jgi:ribose transport system substrate-binding protein
MDGKIVIGLVEKASGPYWEMLNLGAFAAGKLFNVDVVIRAPESSEDVNGEVQAMRELMSQGVEGLAFVPVTPTPFLDVTKEALSSGLPLLTFDLDAPFDGRLAHVGSIGPCRLGEMAGEILAELLEPGQKVAIQVGSRKSEGALAKLAGFTTVMQTRGINIARIIYDDESPGQATTQLRELLEEIPDLKGLYGTYGYHPGIQAKLVAEKGRQIHIVGFDTFPETLKGIQAGIIDATICVNEYYMGYYTVALLTLMIKFGVDEALEFMGLKNKPIENRIVEVSPKIVRKANLNEFENWMEATIKPKKQ